jgi:hypothetical protein
MEERERIDQVLERLSLAHWTVEERLVRQGLTLVDALHACKPANVAPRLRCRETHMVRTVHRASEKGWPLLGRGARARWDLWAVFACASYGASYHNHSSSKKLHFCNRPTPDTYGRIGIFPRALMCPHVPALRPFGGSVVIFSPFSSTDAGKMSLGYEVSHNRKSGCTSPAVSCCSQINSSLGRKDLARWQFYDAHAQEWRTEVQDTRSRLAKAPSARSSRVTTFSTQ